MGGILGRRFPLISQLPHWVVMTVFQVGSKLHPIGTADLCTALIRKSLRAHRLTAQDAERGGDPKVTAPLRDEVSR